MKRVAILGASRGLGAWIANELKNEELEACLISSRKTALLQELADSFPTHIKSEVFVCDYTDKTQQNRLLGQLENFMPDTIIYCAGGGPYGDFAQKDFKDHEWAFQLGFIFPAKLLHFAATLLRLKGLQQITFVGSQIAEAKADPRASSYAASKHALKGLITSVVAEGEGLDIRLYSPGYMDTEMLPPNAHARQSGHKIWDPQDVAKDLVAWLKSPKTTFHRVLD